MMSLDVMFFLMIMLPITSSSEVAAGCKSSSFPVNLQQASACSLLQQTTHATASDTPPSEVNVAHVQAAEPLTASQALQNDASLLEKILKVLRPLSDEDKGIANAGGFLATAPEQIWAGIVTVQLIVIVWFLSSLDLSQKGEDLSFYQAFPVACLWAVMGISLILFNKLLFLPDGVGFGFPFAVFLMWWHAFCGTISTNVLRLLKPSLLPAAAGNELTLQKYIVNVMPVSGVQATALALGNIAYLYISVAYIQMIKNTMSAWVYMFSIGLALETGTYSTTFAVFLVLAGLMLSSVGELSFTLIGFICQMGSTLCDALKVALMKIVMSAGHSVKLDPVSALYYAAPTMCAFLTVPMLLYDGPELKISKIWELKFVLLSNGLVAFGLNMTSFFFIKRCGPTTYALSGVAKDIALILISCVAFGKEISLLQWVGFVISFIGFQLYNKLKEDGLLLKKVVSSLGFPVQLDSKSEEETTPLMAEQMLKGKAGAEPIKSPK